MNEEELISRLENLEMRSAWQDEMLDSLNKTIHHQEKILNLQQQQLRYLYSKMMNAAGEYDEMSPANDKPPHY